MSVGLQGNTLAAVKVDDSVTILQSRIGSESLSPELPILTELPRIVRIVEAPPEPLRQF